jgi:hypothetical protein
MSILAKYTKQPADVQDYDISYVDWLAALNTTAGSVVVETTTGVTQPQVATVTAGVVNVWIAGGTDGQAYKVTCTLTTTDTPARVKQVEIVIKVKET